MTMGVVSMLTMSLWKAGALVLDAALFAWVAPWQLPVDAWWTWAIAILGVDFFFYWAHRVAHRVRLVWAIHQAHHSSEYFNFATALRQKWNNSAAETRSWDRWTSTARIGLRRTSCGLFADRWTVKTGPSSDLDLRSSRILRTGRGCAARQPLGARRS